jgi:hypothetical protein
MPRADCKRGWEKWYIHVPRKKGRWRTVSQYLPLIEFMSFIFILED